MRSRYGRFEIQRIYGKGDKVSVVMFCLNKAETICICINKKLTKKEMKYDSLLF